jgi:ankyrin repeat protein
MSLGTTAYRQPNDILCSECGFLMAHYMCRTFKSTEGDDTMALRDLLQGALNAEDNYGNTPLHFMAASDKVPHDVIISHILTGANVHARNSSGETFLHVLRRRNQQPVCISSDQSHVKPMANHVALNTTN